MSVENPHTLYNFYLGPLCKKYYPNKFNIKSKVHKHTQFIIETVVCNLNNEI